MPRFIFDLRSIVRTVTPWLSHRMEPLCYISVIALMALVGIPTVSRAQGIVDGDVFVTTNGGEVRRIAGRQVLLIPADYVDTRIHRICARRDSLYHSKDSTANYTAFYTDSLLPLERELSAKAATSVRTSVEAHYRFADVKPGAYYVWTETILGTQHVRWLVPVTVKRGQKVTTDLNNSNFEEVTIREPVCSVIDR